MEWQNTPESSNIEDRRGQGTSAGMGGGGPSFGTGGMGIGVIVVVLIVSYFTGINPAVLLGGAQVLTGNGAQQQQTQQAANAPSPTRRIADDRTTSLVRHVLGETEAVWSEILPAQKGVRYTPTTLVLYTGGTRSGCGGAQAAMGPFYCPADKKIYLDTAFFNEMQRNYGGGGDFAYAYVIAHEVGHHVQDLLGILDRADAQKAQVSRTQANAISVRIELQADCLAGVWAANANKKWNLIDQNDVARAVATAQAIGDDTLQKAARGYAVPDSFTHGSSALREKWLETGLQSGEVDSCNTGAQ
ncbi:MAG TPA: neutral zinc metallopeptidase [Roseiarcus sp.]|nr:neutral zinc metallopeptidase [Roseiarcus sp.]